MTACQGREVSHHPDNRVNPSVYHQRTKPCQGLGFTPNLVTSLWKRSAVGEIEFWVLHDLGCRLALETLPSPVINWTARDIRQGVAFVCHL